MSDPLLSAVGNSGAVPIEHNGRTYRIHAWTDKLRARYTRWAQKYVVDKLRQMREILSSSEYEKQFASLTKDIVDGEYSFGKPRLARLTETEDGITALVTVLLDEELMTDEEIKSLLTSKGDEILSTLQRLNGGEAQDPGDEDPKARM